jgi:hypothetical protein
VTGRPFELITIEPECLEIVSGAAA